MSRSIPILVALVLVTAWPAAAGRDPSPPPPAATSAAQDGAPATASSSPPKTETNWLRFDVVASPATSLFVWIDNLSGVSSGKTRESYVQAWRAVHGEPSAEDRDLLARWRALRRSAPAPPSGRPEHVPGTCVPAEEETRSRQQRLAIAAAEAESREELVALAASWLTPAEAADFALALAHFEPRARHFWNDMPQARDFVPKLDAFLDGKPARALIDRFLAFHGGTFADHAPPRLSLVPIGDRWGGTHAEAIGRHLLLEIRTRDVPETQVQVVFHELSHDLFARMPAERRALWASWFLSRGPGGAIAWEVLREALPTALGQGVAEATLARKLWDMKQPWYHIEIVDRYAKAIYPLVKRAIEEGRPFDEALAAEFVTIFESQRIGEGSLLAHFSTSVFAASRALAPYAQAAAERAGSRRGWLATLGATSGESFLATFRCVPLLAFAGGVSDAERLRSFEPDLPAYPVERFAGDPRLGALIVPARRASGAAAIVVFVDPSRLDARALTGALSDARLWPLEPIAVRAQARASE